MESAASNPIPAIPVGARLAGDTRSIVVARKARSYWVARWGQNWKSGRLLPTRFQPLEGLLLR